MSHFLAQSIVTGSYIINISAARPTHGGSGDLGGARDPEQPSPASSLSPLTDQPTPLPDEYAVVRKPKKSAPAPAANGSQPGAIYAVVDKTKKKSAPEASGSQPEATYAVVDKKKSAPPAKPKTNPKPKKGKEKEKKDGKDDAGLFLC